MSNLKLHPALSGNNAASAQQLSAPAPTTPVVPGAGPSLHGAMGIDPDGFPSGTPLGVRNSFSPQEYMARHPELFQPSMPQQPIASPSPSPAMSPPPAAPPVKPLEQMATDFYKMIQKRE